MSWNGEWGSCDEVDFVVRLVASRDVKIVASWLRYLN